MKHSVSRRMLAALAAVTLTVGAMPLSVHADEPYDVYNYNYLGEAVPSQAGYVAERAVSGIDLGTAALSAPSDLCKDTDDCFYIADTGNNRIVKTDPEFQQVLKIYDTFTMPDGTQTKLNHPKGIYISPDTGLLYIADSDNARALIADADGMVQQVITKPDSPVYDQQLTFLPQKILCDNAGNVYIVLGNTTKGAAMFGADGAFIGYYGANTVKRTASAILNHFWNSHASQEERKYRVRNAPSPFDNFDIDTEKGFIFTSTSSGGSSMDAVKKVNPEGHNLFSYLSGFVWGDEFSTWYGGTSYQTKIVDIDIGDDQSINCLDTATGRVFQYDEEANLLFIMGTIGDQLGGFTQGGVSAVETKGAGCENIYVLDSMKGTVTIFSQTDFGETVHRATALYNDGKYAEALSPWLEVLKYDGSYRRAYIGVSSAYYNMGRYKESMDYAKKADASNRYNRAFAKYRAQFLKAHLTEILVGIVLLIVLVSVGKRIFRKRKKKPNA